jgi:hypothetical protein
MIAAREFHGFSLADFGSNLVPTMSQKSGVFSE